MLTPEPIYKALTRPPLVFGVPMVPFMFMGMFWGMAAMLLQALISPTYLILFFMIIPNMIIFQMIVKKDDMAFRLWGLKVKFFRSPAINKFYNGRKSYMANSTYSKMPSRNNYPKLSVVGLSEFANLENLIPYQTLVEDIAITKDGDYLASWRVDGIPFEVEDDELIDMDKNKLNMLIRQFAGENVSFYFHNARMNISVNPNEHFSNEFLKDFSKKYYEIFNSKNLKENRLYLTAIYSPLSRAEKISFKNQNIQIKMKSIKNHLKSFERICNTIEQNLKHFKPYRLGVYEIDGMTYSPRINAGVSSINKSSLLL